HRIVHCLDVHSFPTRRSSDLLKIPEYEPSAADEFLQLDLGKIEGCLTAATGVSEVYALAANMGGMGFISSNHSQILRDNSLINIDRKSTRLNSSHGSISYDVF